MSIDGFGARIQPRNVISNGYSSVTYGKVDLIGIQINIYVFNSRHTEDRLVTVEVGLKKKPNISKSFYIAKYFGHPPNRIVHYA